MGKSLSILAITTQVYNINGWSIWPPHLALGDDVELPIAMEHLRPYLRKRKGPIRAPPGLRHNQRYYPKATQSRELLMEREKSLIPPPPDEISRSQLDNDEKSDSTNPSQLLPEVEILKVDTPNIENYDEWLSFFDVQKKASPTSGSAKSSQLSSTNLMRIGRDIPADAKNVESSDEDHSIQNGKRNQRENFHKNNPNLRIQHPGSSATIESSIATVQSTFSRSTLGKLNNNPEYAASQARALIDSLSKKEYDTSEEHRAELWNQAISDPNDYDNIAELTRVWSKYESDGGKFNKFTVGSADDEQNAVIVARVRKMVFGLRSIDDIVDKMMEQFGGRTEIPGIISYEEFLGFGYFFELFKEMFVRFIQFKHVLPQDRNAEFTYRMELIHILRDVYKKKEENVFMKPILSTLFLNNENKGISNLFKVIALQSNMDR